MYNLNKKEKLEFVLQKIQELGISAYEISNNSKITEAGVSRIIKGIAKNPHESSIDIILEYLEKRNKTSENNKVEEDPPIYEAENKNYNFEGNPLVICLHEKNKLTREVIYLQGLLRKNNINFKDIFEEND